MAKVDMNDCYQEVPYSKCPTYFMHTDYDGEKTTFSIQDGDNEKLTITVGGADSITINGTEYYNKSKVDNLLSALEAKLTAAIATAKSEAISEAESDAAGKYQPKGG